MPVGRSARAVVVATAAVPALAGLRAAPNRCGDHTCQPHQYCSRSTESCDDCSTICQPLTRNYQEDICHSDCQDYLHDMKYQARDDDVNVTAAMLRLEGDLHRLTIIVSVMFCLFIVCFIGLAAYACCSYRKACRRRKTADLENNSIELKKIGAKIGNGVAAPTPVGPPVISPKSGTVPPYAVGGRPPSLSLSVKPAEEPKRRHSRHPSEDTCPGDYSVVYDNPGLVATPPAAGSYPVAAGGPPSLQSRDSFRPAGSASSGRTESTRLPREVDVTDMSPARAVRAF